MIEYSILCMIASGLLVATPIIAIEIATACAVKAEKSKAKKELLAQQMRDKLAQKEYEKILKQMKCKWNDKVECRQGRSCDYCVWINCTKKSGEI